MIVWIASYPRSGNSLLRILLHRVFDQRTYSQHNDEQDIAKDPELRDLVGHRSYESSWPTFYEHARKSRQLYLIKSHELPQDDSKAIYIVRRGDSALVSYYHYLHDFAQRQVTLAEITLGCTVFGSWSDHIRAWNAADRPNTLLLRFEDLAEAPGPQLEKISAFLDLPIQNEADVEFAELHAKHPRFFRSGKDEANRRELDPATAALFDLLHGDMMVQLGYERPQDTTVDPWRIGPALEAIRTRLIKSQSEAADARKDAEAQKAEIDSLRNEIWSLNKQNDELEMAKTAREKEIAALTNRNEAIEQAKAGLESEFARLAKLSAVRAEKLNRYKSELSGGGLSVIRAVRRARRSEWIPEDGLSALGSGSVDTSPQNARKSVYQGAQQRGLVPEAYRVIPPQTQIADDVSDFGIAVFGFNRPHLIENMLTSLGHQNALPRVHVFLDGNQGNPTLRRKTDEVAAIAERFPVKKIHRREGNLGFRKMMLQAMRFMCERYETMLFLEDDCFPSRECVDVMRADLDAVRDRPDVFSVYGHHFETPNEIETEFFPRFQGWGWACHATRLAAVLPDLMRCYWMDEETYRAFVRDALNQEIKARIDVTPGRQPSATLTKFFAWDETLCLLTALRGMTHKKSSKRVIYNCGAGQDSAHFFDIEHFRRAPFNMIAPEEAWSHFERSGSSTN